MGKKLSVEEKFDQFKSNFDKDPKIQGLIRELKAKTAALHSASFTPEELESEEYDDLIRGVDAELRECDPDEFTIFDILFANNYSV